MSRTVAKGSPPPPKPTRQNDFFQQLQLLLQDVNNLWSRVTAEVNRAAHSEEADVVILTKECDICLSEYKKLSEWTAKLKSPVENRILMLNSKTSSGQQDPIPAFTLQTIMVLHLVSNQTISKRVEEINEIERRRKDEFSKLEAWLKQVKERFTDIVPRFNLLCFMRDCLKKDGFLPRNIMYNTNIPQTVVSPFVEPPKPSSKVIPLNARRDLPQLTKEQQERDIEKRKKYLQMQEEQRKQQKIVEEIKR